MAVVRIDHLPTGTDATPTQLRPYYSSKNVSGNDNDDDGDAAMCSGPMPPVSEHTAENQKLRTGLKFLHMVKPEGASFVVTEEAAGSGGAVIDWQNWRFRTGSNHREGPVLYNIAYNGRSIVYRISLSDRCISYADPRPPYHKKAAIGLGDAVRIRLTFPCPENHSTSLFPSCESQYVVNPPCFCFFPFNGLTQQHGYRAQE